MHGTPRHRCMYVRGDHGMDPGPMHAYIVVARRSTYECHARPSWPVGSIDRQWRCTHAVWAWDGDGVAMDMHPDVSFDRATAQLLAVSTAGPTLHLSSAWYIYIVSGNTPSNMDNVARVLIWYVLRTTLSVLNYKLFLVF